MHKVYVLESKKDSELYIGCTQDIDQRMIYHKTGRVKSTKYRRPLQLIYIESFQDKHRAFNTERFYKTAKGKRVLKKKMEDCRIV